MDNSQAQEAIQEPVVLANYISDQTLGEMGDQDKDNFKFVMQNKTYVRRFRGWTEANALEKARVYQRVLMDRILKSHGFKMTPAMAKNPKIVDVVLEQKCKLRIETRLYPPEEEVYQTGVYILKLRKAGEGDLIDHEIVGFISEPYKDQDPNSKIIYFNPEVCIRTTEKL